MLVEQVMGERTAYPSDLTDEQWAVVGPFLDAWKAKHPSVSGHQGRYSLREILNSIFYQNRTGCQWAYLPHDLPPKSATYYYFAVWRDDGTDQAIHDLLRCQAREQAGRREDPSAIILDTQSIRAANHVPAATTGKDAGKKVPGRKRGLAVDALGLIIAVVVTAASVTDTAIGVRLLDKVVEHTPTITRAWVDAGFKHDLGIHGALLGVDVEVVKRSDTSPGFVPIAKRVGRRTGQRHVDAAPSPGPRVRKPPGVIGVAHPVGLGGQPRAPADRHQHTVLAGSDMNTTTVLDLIAAREAAASEARDELREQMTKLAAEAAAIECELADLATTRQTLIKILEHEVTASEPAVISEPYSRSSPYSVPTAVPCARKTSASLWASAPNPKTPKVSAPGSNAWSTARS